MSTNSVQSFIAWLRYIYILHLTKGAHPVNPIPLELKQLRFASFPIARVHKTNHIKCSNKMLSGSGHEQREKGGAVWSSPASTYCIKRRALQASQQFAIQRLAPWLASQ